MGSAKTPSVPDPAKQYATGIRTSLAYAPQIAGAEYKMRAEFDDPSVEQNLARTVAYAPQAIDQYRQTLSSVSPWSTQVRDQQAADVSAELAKGYSLDASTTRQVQQSTRAQEVASGNVLGNAAVSKEATAVGTASFQAFQRRITGATTFLQQDRALQQLTMAAALETKASTNDRADYYVAPDAGTNGQNSMYSYYEQDLQTIQNWEANYQDYLSPGQRMAQGAYIGLREGWQGGSLFGFVAGAFGAIGGALGGSFQGLINSPDYQWNVSLNQYNIYGTPADQTAASAGSAGVGVALSAASAFG